MEAKLIKFLEAVIEDYNYYNEENPEQGSAEWGCMAEMERVFDDISKILKCTIRYDGTGNASIEW